MNLNDWIVYAGGAGSGCTGPNCGRKPLYHGTLDEYAKNIKREGLVPGKGRPFPASEHGIVYVSDNKETARTMALWRATQEHELNPASKAKPAIVTLRLPAVEAKKLMEDPDFPGEGEEFPGKIPPKYIIGIEPITKITAKEKNWMERAKENVRENKAYHDKFALRAASNMLLYLVYFGDLEKLYQQLGRKK